LPDRRLVGLLGIALVVATVVTGVTFNVREEEKVVMLATQVPEAVQCQTKATLVHSFDFMVAQDLPDVVVRCAFLAKPPESVYGIPWGQAGLAQKQLVQGLLDGLEGTVAQKPYQTYELTTDTGSELTIVDFTEAMTMLAGEDRVKDFYTIFVIERLPGGNVSFYRGVMDFFFNRDSTIAQISYSGRNMSKTFRSELMGESAEGYPALSEIPSGKIRFQNLLAGQKVHVEVTVQTESMLCQEGVFRLLRLDTGYGLGAMVVERIGYTPIPMDRG